MGNHAVREQHRRLVARNRLRTLFGRDTARIRACVLTYRNTDDCLLGRCDGARYMSYMLQERPTLAGVAALRDPLTPDSPLWAWATEAIGSRAEHMLDHLEGVEAGEDIESVHDMRVGSRRLVAAMKVFASCFPERAYQLLLKEARRVTRSLGGVRDFDVLIDHYGRLRPQADAEEAPAIDYFVSLRRRDRDRARKPMLADLRKLDQSHFPARLRKYLRREAEAYAVGLGPEAGLGAGAGRPFRAAAPGFLEQRHAELYEFEPYVARPEAAEQLHEMRIAAKWLRYTMELFAPAYADGLREPLGAVKKVQELLGDLHDSDIRLWTLQEMVEEALDPRGLKALRGVAPRLVTGGLRRLLERETAVRAGCYQAFYKEWLKLERKAFRQESLARIGRADAPA